MSSLVRTALVACMKQERISVRAAARHFGVAKSTVERWRKKGFVIPVLRSRRVAPCFLRCLIAAERNGRAT